MGPPEEFRDALTGFFLREPFTANETEGAK